ncbi:MAG TPA: PAS domain S-box protein, partial [Actinomycetota bacterium]|nr:PAS domain S-box protein [Actinomycetota bacterium]
MSSPEARPPFARSGSGPGVPARQDHTATRGIPPAAEADLLRDLALTVGEAGSLDEAFGLVLERICVTTGWALGQAWTPRQEGDSLMFRRFHATVGGLESFIELSRVHRFPPGMGLPGRVWERGKPIWIKDVRRDLSFTRGKEAAEVGLVGAMAVPVLARGEPVAVLEFFELEQRERDADMLEMVSAAAAQLGSVIRRRRAEEAAYRIEQRFRSVAETARDSIISADEKGLIIYVNEAANATFGYEGDELVGQPLTVLMPTRFRDPHLAGLARFTATGEAKVIGKRSVELAGRRKTGEDFPIELSLATWASEERTFFTGIIRDITERRRAEEELRRLYELKSEFIAQAAHELRTPLTILSGFATTLADRRDQLSETQLEEFFDILRFQSGRVLGLVDGLLDVARLDQETPAAELDRIALGPVVSGSLHAAPPPEGWEVRTSIPRGL